MEFKNNKHQYLLVDTNMIPVQIMEQSYDPFANLDDALSSALYHYFAIKLSTKQKQKTKYSSAFINIPELMSFPDLKVWKEHGPT